MINHKTVLKMLIVFCIFDWSSACLLHSKSRAFEKINCSGEIVNANPIVCYQLKLAKIIEKKWLATSNVANLDDTLETKVLIKILNDGRLEEMKFEKKSGNSILDEAAINEIGRAHV